MPKAIVYCEKCGKLIPPSEIDRGRAVVFGEGGVCAECVSSMPPAELREIRSRFPGLPGPPAGPVGSGAPVDWGPRPSQRTVTVGTGGPVRRRSHKGIAVAAFAVAGLAAAAITFLSSRPAAGPGDRPDGAAPGRARPASTAGPDAYADGGAPTRGGDAVARGRLAKIKSWIDPSHARHAEARTALVEFAAKCDDLACAAEAKVLVTRMDRELAARAKEEFKETMESAEALVSEGKLAEARKAVDGFRERFAGGEWFKAHGEEAVAEALGRIDAARAGAVKDILARAREAFESGHIDKARAALGARLEWPEDLRASADALLKEMDEAEAEQAARTKLAEAWGAFPPGFVDAGKLGLGPAKAFLERERKALVALGADDEIKTKLAGVERLFRGVDLVEELGEVGFKGARGTVYFHWKGERVGGRIQRVEEGVLSLVTTRGRNVTVPIPEIAGADVVRYSRRWGIHFTQVPPTCSVFVHGGLSPHACRVSGQVWHGCCV
ncbi:MAG: hypothetical protein ACYTKD_05175, partial [Planctomycetota bacterium]